MIIDFTHESLGRNIPDESPKEDPKDELKFAKNALGEVIRFLEEEQERKEAEAKIKEGVKGTLVEEAIKVFVKSFNDRIKNPAYAIGEIMEDKKTFFEAAVKFLDDLENSIVVLNKPQFKTFNENYLKRYKIEKERMLKYLSNQEITESLKNQLFEDITSLSPQDNDYELKP